jgi:hypothetical protein
VKGNEVAATVLTPEGIPAVRAKVVIGLAESTIRIQGGEVDSLADASAFRETDAVGRFHLTARAPDFWLVITHPSGCVQINGLPNSNPGVIRLAPWARAEGAFRAGRKVQRHAKVSIIGGHQLYWPNGPFCVINYQETDSDGRFVFERVFPGTGRIGRSFVFNPRNDSLAMTSRSWLPATFLAGKTATIDLGTTGRPVIGQLRRAPNTKDQIPWSRALVGVRPDVAGVHSNPHLHHFTATVDRDGNFAIDDVPVGNYLLDVRITNEDRVDIALKSLHVSVPAVNEKLSQRPVDLGVLTLER